MGLRRPPLQARSEETLDRILRATEALLDRKPFEDIGISEILEKSGVSASSFYARFKSRDDLLPWVYARYSDSERRLAAERFDPGRLANLDFAETIRLLTREAVATYRARRGLLRTVALLARSRPSAVSRGALRERAEQYAEAAGLLLRFRSEILHPDPELAVTTGILMILSLCREKVLFGDAPHPRSVDIDDDALGLEAARALHAYLTTRPRL